MLVTLCLVHGSSAVVTRNPGMLLRSLSSTLCLYNNSIEGVSKIKDGYNPTTWMLEVTTTTQELSLGVDFTDLFKNSYLYRRNKQLIQELG
ncbi:hypothetical protein S245_007919 [Arachis hypogaea]